MAVYDEKKQLSLSASDAALIRTGLVQAVIKANVKCNEKQRCEVLLDSLCFSLCFRQLLKTIFYCISVYEQMIWSLWFVEGSWGSTHVHSDALYALSGVVINPIGTANCSSPQELRFVVVNSSFYWAERGECLVVGQNQGSFLFFFPHPLPPSSEGLDAVTPR